MDALINVVVPVFGVVLTGYLAGRFEVLGSDSAAALNRFVFYFALPPALFIFMARAPAEKIFNWPFIGAFVGGEFATLLIALIVGRVWFHQDLATRTVAGLAALQANTVYMGLPLLLTAYGPDGALPTIVATLCLTFVFISSVIAVLESTRASEQSTFRMAAQVASRVLRNPLVISPLLGILFSIAALPLPKAASNYLDLMAATVGPAALFSLGLSLIGRKLTGNMAEVIWLSTLKAIINPALTFALVTYVFAMDSLWSKAAIILAAMPTGANAYVVAQQYNVHVETVSSVVVLSTGISVVTISILLIWLGVG
jgi:malonate transporter and related proteins